MRDPNSTLSVVETPLFEAADEMRLDVLDSEVAR
jgi:hypothetical protein